MDVLTGGRWLATVLAPWAISPHPNFSVNEASPEELLALVAEVRLADLERYRDEGVLAGGREFDLIDAARDSLRPESQVSAASRLRDLSADRSLPAGARLASALFAAACLADLDQIAEAIQLLQGLKRSLEKATWNRRHTGTRAIALNALSLQLAVRHWEAGHLEAARVCLSEIRDLESSSDFEPFKVSRGISWTSKGVQRDIQLALHRRSDAILAKLEPLDGNAWMAVVRSRPPWPDVRIDWRQATSTQAFVDDRFEHKFAVFHNKVGFRREDPIVAPAVQSLLAAELGADINEILRSRENLAKLLLLSRDNSDPSIVREALKLLRTARATSALKDSLQWVRSHGPNVALAQTAASVVTRPNLHERMSESDILILGDTADFLSEKDSRRAADALINYIFAIHVDHARSWKSVDDAWEVLVQFARQGTGVDEIASRAIEFALSRVFGPANYGTFSSLIEAIDWSQVSDSTLSAWRDWSTQQSDDSGLSELHAAFLRQAEGIGTITPVVPGEGLERVIWLVNEVDAGDLLDDDRHISERLIGDELTRIRDDAKRGAAAFGGIDDLDLAVAFAAKFGSGPVWDAVTNLLIDPLVNSDLKRRGLDRIARSTQFVPPKALATLTRGWAGLRESQRHGGFFGSHTGAEFPEALRAGSALGIDPAVASIAAITRLISGDSARDRVEAARSVNVVADALQNWDWAVTTLVYLAHDHDPVVRAEAGRGLARAIFKPSSLTEFADENLRELLAADGVLVPLLALHGLQVAAREGHRPPHSVRAVVRSLLDSHPSRVVREAAREVVEHIGG